MSELLESRAGPEGDGDADLASLLERVVTRDVAAFSALHVRTAAPVYRVARRVLDQHALAEEVTQEVYLEVWERAARYDASRGSVEGWLSTIARNRALSKRRSVGAVVARDHRHAIDDAPECDDEVAERVITRMEGEAVRRGLQELTPLQLQAVVLYYYDGCTTAEIARRLAIPHGTAKTRLRDGVERLRRVMRDVVDAA